MQSLEDTKPNRADVFPEEENETGPGCIIWGIVGLMGVMLSFAIVLTAAEAGVRQGAVSGERTAAVRTQDFIARECQILPTDIALQRIPIVQNRYDNWTQQGEIPACAQAYIPQATQIYLDSLVTVEPTATATLEPTLESTATEIPAATSETASTNPQPTSIYDLDALLQEARDSITERNYSDAIQTLDAIVAIDPQFQTGTVNQLLFTSLTTRATNLYRTDGSLAEAIQLTNRAENYGDIAELSYERSVAQYYLDAQGFLDVNYSAAIQQLNLVRSLASNYRDTNQLLVRQLEGYGDLLLISGEACQAVSQYDAALAIQPQPNIQTKRNDAQTQCTSPALATTDPNATVDPNQPVVPTATPTSGIAPVGQSGG